MQWFRLYTEFATDPKVQSLSEILQRRLIMIFCLHCAEDISKLSDEDIAFFQRISPADIKETKNIFMKKGFIDHKWRPKNWAKRQKPSDSSAERSRKYRANKSDVTVTSPSRRGDALEQSRVEEKILITNCSSLTATTPEPKKAAALQKEFLDILGGWFPRLNPTNPRFFRMLAKWCQNGVVPSDISAALECKRAEQAEIKTPLYFENIVVDFAKARQEGKRPPGKKLTNAEILAEAEARCLIQDEIDAKGDVHARH